MESLVGHLDMCVATDKRNLLWGDMMEEKIYKIDGENMIINWKNLNKGKILTETELIIFYTLCDKIKDNQ